MIKGIQLHKKFNDLNVLNGINISIAEREIVSIVGKSGAGKTTLLQILGTLEKPSTGKVLYDEKNVFDLNENELADFRNKNISGEYQKHLKSSEKNEIIFINNTYQFEWKAIGKGLFYFIAEPKLNTTKPKLH